MKVQARVCGERKDMKKNGIKKPAALLLSVILLAAGALAVSGCGTENKNVDNTAGKTPDGGQDEKQMGRYVEASIELPEEVQRAAGPVRLEDGKLMLVDYNQGPYLSEDEGQTWVKKYEDWTGMLGSGYYMNCAIAGDGRIFMEYQLYPETDGEDGTVEEVAAESGAMEGGADTGMRYALISLEGEVKQLSLSFEGAPSPYLNNCWFTPDGQLLAAAGHGVYQIDQDGGQTALLFEAEEEIQAACFSGETMVGFGSEKAYWFDLKARTLLEQEEELDAFLAGLTQESGGIYFTSGDYLFLSALSEDGTLYLACEKGLYSYSRQEGEMKLLMEGALSTLGDPSVARVGMLWERGEFLLLFGNSLSRISYDANLPSVPEKELSVYSLERSGILQQAVSIYQKAHPEVLVRYETGMDGDSGQTREDAVKALNTRLMAGEGPDVMLLDGLPFASYVEKGMLAELDGLYQEISRKEPLYENIALSLEEQGKLCAIPAAFRIPLAFGDEETLQGLSDLASMADAAEALREKQEQGAVLAAYVPETLLAQLVSSCAPAWRDDSGNVDEEAVRDFFTQAKRMYDAETAGLTETDQENYRSTHVGSDQGTAGYLEAGVNLAWSVMESLSRSSALTAGELSAVSMDYCTVISLMRIQPGFTFRSAPGQAENAFRAEAVAGISALTKEKELAEDFVKTLFSDQVMSKVTEAFPVNRESFRKGFDTQDRELAETEAFGMIAVDKQDGSMQSLDIYWPDEREQERLEQIVAGLKTPYLPGDVLEQTVLETGLQVLEGSLNVEEGVEQVKEKVRLYLAEQA